MFPETNSISIPGLTTYYHYLIGEEKSPTTITKYLRDLQKFLTYTAGLTESLFRFCRSLRMQSQANQTTTPGLLPRGKGTFKRRVLSPHKSRAGIAERPPLLNNPDHLQYRNPDQRTGMYYRPSGAKRRGRSKLQRQEPANFHSP